MTGIRHEHLVNLSGERYDGADTMGSGMRFYDIAKLLKEQREAKGWSQRKVARMIGTSSSSVHYWESGQHGPGIEGLLRWVEVLGYQIELVKMS